MRQFKVYRHPSGALECVKPGFSWPVFFFGGFHGFRQKLWWPGAAELAVLLMLHLLSVPLLFACLCVLAYHAVVGWQGQAWLARHLLAQGYRHADTVTAEDSDRALALSIRQRGWRVSSPISG